jgi:hypothetical protein
LIKGITNPTLEYIKPEKPNGTAIIVIAGGGYGVIVYNGEGLNTAKSLAEKGISAFVLKYRLPSDEIMQIRKSGRCKMCSSQSNICVKMPINTELIKIKLV